MAFIREVDSVGRIVIPKDLRRTLELTSDDNIEITLENGCIVLTKSEEEV